MARVTINDDDPCADGYALPAGLGVDLETNIGELQDNRLKRHSVTYYLGPTSSTASDPPTGDDTLLGPNVYVQGSLSNDPQGRGLQLSSPPTGPIAVFLGEWPLSAHATRLRVVVGCETEEADVDLYACAVLGGGVVPHPPGLHLVVDDEGLAEFDATITASDAHVTVSTAEPSGSQACKPVVLEVDLGTASHIDHGFAGAGDGVRTCRVYLCILSLQGSAAPQPSVPTSINEGGRRLTYVATFASLGINPGPYHRWVYFEGDGSEVSSDEGSAWFPMWRGVVQVRPDDLDNPATATSTSIVIHPPLGRDSAARTDAEFTIYTCGVVTIHAATVQELSA